MLSLLLAFSILSFSLGVKVVVFLPGTTEFERKTLDLIAQQLAFRYHETATFKGILIPEIKYLVKHKLHDVRELVLKDLLKEDLYKPIEFMGTGPPWYENYDTIEHAVPFWKGYANACEPVLNSDLIDRIKDGQYDVALVYAGNPCNLAIVHTIGIPFIYVDVTGFSDEIMVASGAPFSPATIPSTRSTFDQQMNLKERIENAWFWLQEYAAFSNIPFIPNVFNPRHRLMDGPISELFRDDYELKKKFPYFPDVNEIKKNADLFFVNSDSVLEFEGRATPPNVVYIGGINVEPPKELFEAWNHSMTSSEDGVIVASLGTQANSTAMPEKLRRSFIDAFANLPKSRIFWRIYPQRWEGLPWIDDVPSNVNVSAYFPQNDMLASKHTKLLITNGGMSSISEAMEYGVPIVGIPLYGCNYNNLRKVEAKGFGLILDKKDLTAQTLHKAIREVLDNPKYRIAAREISRAFRARNQTPLETAISWIEYVAKNQGAPFLRSKTHTPLYKQLMLDVAVLGLIGYYFIYKLSTYAMKIIRRKQPEQMSKKANEQKKNVKPVKNE